MICPVYGSLIFGIMISRSLFLSVPASYFPTVFLCWFRYHALCLSCTPEWNVCTMCNDPRYKGFHGILPLPLPVYGFTLPSGCVTSHKGSAFTASAILRAPCPSVTCCSCLHILAASSLSSRILCSCLQAVSRQASLSCRISPAKSIRSF